MKLGFYLEKLSLFLIGLFLLFFPLALSTLTTDSYGLPKQALLVAASLLTLLAFGFKMVVSKTVKVRRTPFDLPLIVFTVVVFFSSVFSVNRADSFMSSLPLLFAVLMYFLIIENAREKGSVSFLLGSFLLGGALASLLAVLSYLKVYLLPWQFTKLPSFTSIGTTLDQAIYFLGTGALALYLIYPALRKAAERASFWTRENLAVSFGFLIVFLGFLVSILSLIKQGLLVLPFETGFQTAFAAISQDTGRIFQSFLLGSGFGTYAVDFTRFKLANFNQHQNLWTLTFVRSSSFLLEILATTGVLGLLSYLFLIFRALKERLVSPVSFLVVISFLLPFSFVTQTLFILVLALFASLEGLSSNKFFDVELAVVSLRKAVDSLPSQGLSRLLPFLVVFIFVVFSFFSSLLSYKHFLANITFQKSLIAASKNNGSVAYDNQAKTLQLVNYSDSYFRTFSQTNLALANSLSNSIPKGSSPSAQQTQTILTLIQQSINSARAATSVSPLTSLNWQNLSSIYRSLIGFGRNADTFSILTSQQAILLDPTNPNEYMSLGGLYYQLKLWDKALEQFQIAANLKPDFANSYYNLGHAYEEKGDLQNALSELRIVKTLVRDDKENSKKIDKEIADLEKGIATKTNLNQPQTQLPPQTPPVTIPAPTTSTKSAK